MREMSTKKSLPLPKESPTNHYETRNVVSWRVPNEPFVANSKQNATFTQRKRRDKEQQQGLQPQKLLGRSDNETIVGEQESDKVIIASNETTPTSDTTKVAAVTFQNRLWKVLFSNFDRAIDELYVTFFSNF